MSISGKLTQSIIEPTETSIVAEHAKAMECLVAIKTILTVGLKNYEELNKLAEKNPEEDRTQIHVSQLWILHQALITSKNLTEEILD